MIIIWRVFRNITTMHNMEKRNWHLLHIIFFMSYLCMGDFFMFISIVISAGAIVNEDFLAAGFPGLLICEDRLCIDGT
jgi:hypothetical protein